MVIRFAQTGDLPAVNELRRQVSQLHAEGKPDVFRQGFCEELQQHLYTIFDAPDHAILVAENERGIVGFACVKIVDRPASPYRKAMRYLDVDEFGVDEGCRRQGIGSAIFERIRELAGEKGISRIELNMWEFNEGALKFYESIGFSTYRRYMEFTTD